MGFYTLKILRAQEPLTLAVADPTCACPQLPGAPSSILCSSLLPVDQGCFADVFHKATQPRLL